MPLSRVCPFRNANQLKNADDAYHYGQAEVGAYRTGNELPADHDPKYDNAYREVGSIHQAPLVRPVVRLRSSR
jgi:hypothetical protein